MSGASAQTFSPLPAPTAPATDATTPAPTPPATSAAECFPSCRAGFTCHLGQCLSLCNPACGADERCTAAGECEKSAALVAPPAAPAPSPAPLPPPITVAQPARSAPATSTEPSVLRTPGTFVFEAHLGLELFGTGHAEDSCTSSRTNECNGVKNTDFEDRSQAVLGVAGLFHAARGLRLGVGYWAMPYSGIRSTGTSNNRKVHLGHEHALHAIVEGLVPLRPSLALALRAHAGPRLLMVGGDLETDNDAFLAQCSMDLVGHHCQAGKGPFFGATFGTMVGIVVGDRARWRADFAVERYSLKIRDANIVDDAAPGLNLSSYEFNADTTLYGTRLWLLAGLEL